MKRAIGLILCLVLVLAMVPVQAVRANSSEDEFNTETTLKVGDYNTTFVMCRSLASFGLVDYRDSWLPTSVDYNANVVEVSGYIRETEEGAYVGIRAISAGETTITLFHLSFPDATIKYVVATIHVTVLPADETPPPPDDGKVTAGLTFDQPSVDYIAGSLGKYDSTAKTFSETSLTPTLTVTNSSKTQNASNIKVTLTAPDGFSFDPDTLKSTYDVPVFDLPVSTGSITFNNIPKVWPIYSDEYNTKDKATFDVSFSYSMNNASRSGSSSKDITIVKHKDIEGKISFDKPGFDTGNTQVNAGQITHTWKLSDVTGSNTGYNGNLSVLSAGLICSTFDESKVTASLAYLGFTDLKYGNFNILSFSGDTVRYVLARKKIINAGQIETLVAVIMSGSITVSDWISNFSLKSSNDTLTIDTANGYQKGFYNAYLDIKNQIDSYYSIYKIPKNGKTRMLVAGYSRSAAVANILAKEFSDDGTFVTRDKLYAYTFATLNVRKNAPTLSGYSHIHNIENNSDIAHHFPMERLGFGRYGQNYYFTKPILESYDDLTIIGNMGVTHDIKLYLSAVMDGKPSESPKIITFNLLDRINIQCPVDVEVYTANNTLAGKITGNTITYSGDKIALLVEGDVKTVYVPSGAGYTLKLTATGTGTMTLTGETIDFNAVTYASPQKVFTNVPLVPGKQMRTQAGGASASYNIKLFVIKDGKDVEEITGKIINGESTAQKLPFPKTQTYSQGKFTDVKSADWFAPNVATAFAFGLMKGTSDTKFTPGGTLTLAEAITLAARIHSIYHTGTENFVQTSTWYQVYVDYALKNGIITHIYGNYNIVTNREEFADILSRALPADELWALHPEAVIPDTDTITAAYRPPVLLLYKAGVLTGYSDGTFRPRNTITRAETAAIVSRMADPGLRM